MQPARIAQGGRRDKKRLPVNGDFGVMRLGKMGQIAELRDKMRRRRVNERIRAVSGLQAFQRVGVFSNDRFSRRGTDQQAILLHEKHLPGVPNLQPLQELCDEIQ